MPQLAPSRRTANVLACLVLLAASIPWAPAAEARATLLSDNFDVVPSAPWTWSGAYVGSDTTAHTPFSSLSMKALSTGQVVTYERTVALDFDVPWNYTASLYFWNEAVSSDSDAWFNLTLADGTVLTLDPTYGPARAGVSFRVGTTPGYRDTYGAVYDQLTWYQLRINIDPVNHTTNAELRDLNDNLLWSSPSRAIPESATGITHLGFYGTWLGTDPLRKPPYKVNFDTLLITTASAPRAPTVAAAPGPGAGEITLTWQPPADDGGAPIYYYNVYGGNESNDLTRIATGVTGTTYTDQGRGNGVRWYYKVAAVNTAGESDFSNETSARTFSPPSVPLAFNATPGPNVGEIRLTWLPPLDDGGAASLSYNLYRSTGADEWSLVAATNNVTNYTDVHLPNGTVFGYLATASNPSGQSNATPVATSAPRPDYATKPNATVSPALAWSGDARAVSFTYDVAASQCAFPLPCPVAHEWRIYQDGSLDGADGVLLANGTNLHDGHAGVATYSEETTIQPTGDPGSIARVKVAVNTREGSTEWNVSVLNVTFDLPQPGYATGPTAPTATPGLVPQRGTLTVESSYSVFQQQCSPTTACPVTNAWAFMVGGTPGVPDGVYLAVGTNQHPAHGETETYNLHREIQLPALHPGEHTLKVLVRHNETAPWQTATTTFTVDPCDANPLVRYSYADASSIPVATTEGAASYTFRLGNASSVEPLRLFNACQNGVESEPEYGRGGARILAPQDGTPFSIWAKDADGSGQAVFFVGTDLDGSRVVGDSLTDCITGPFIEYANVTCLPDATGHVLAFLYEDYYNLDYPLDPPYVVDVNGIDVPRAIIWHGGCVPAWTPTIVPGERCVEYDQGYTSRNTQTDGNNNGMGDAWENEVCNESGLSAEDCARDIIEKLLSVPDMDNDRLFALDEFRWDTIPAGPITVKVGEQYLQRLTNAPDYDQDNWMDGAEQKYWNNPANDQLLFDVTAEYWKQQGISPRDPDFEVEYWPDGDRLYTVHDDDVDGDGVKDGDEHRVNWTYPQFPDSDCELRATPTCSKPPAQLYGSEVIYGVPGSGDRINDKDEYDRWKDIGTRVFRNADLWKTDFDGDNDVFPTNLLDPDADGDGEYDGVEFLGVPYQTLPYDPDSDQDGLLDGRNIVVAEGDYRYDWFKGLGIVYNQLDLGRREFMGELDNGANPENPHTWSSTQKDGELVAGTRGSIPTSDSERYRGFVASNEELASIDATADDWLTRNVWQANASLLAPTSAMVAPFLANPISATHDLANTTVNKTPVALIDRWVPDASAAVDEAKECVPLKEPTAEDPTPQPPSPEALFPSVQCLAGVVETVALQPLGDLLTETLSQINDTALGVVNGLPGLEPDTLFLVDPVLAKLPVRNITWDPTDLGTMPRPPSPFNTGDDGTPPPIDDIDWPATPFPQVFADKMDNMLTGRLYQTVASADAGDPASLEIIGTIDAGAFNVLVHDEAANQTHIRKNVPLGAACFVDYERPPDDDCTLPPLSGAAEMLVQAEIVTDALTGEITPKVTVKKLSLTPQKVLAAAFLQIPNSSYVVALGSDASPSALGADSPGAPAEVQVMLSTNALRRAVHKGIDPTYTVSFVVPQPNGAARFVASYFQVVETVNPKQPVPGERADLAINFTHVPSTATATLTLRASGGGMRLAWSSSPMPDMDVTVAARIAHAGTKAEATAFADDLPQSITTDYQKGARSFLLQHTASSVVPFFSAVWNGTENGMKFAGGANLTGIPASATLTFDAAAAAGSFTTDSTLGSANFISFVQPATATSSPSVCTKGAGEYFTHKETKEESCTALNVTSLKSLTAAFAGDLTLKTQRDAPGGPLLVHVDDASTKLLADATTWPQTVDISTSKAATRWTMTASLGQVVSGLNLTYLKPSSGTSVTLRGLGLPASSTVIADYPTGEVKVTASTSTRIGDVSFRYAEAWTDPDLGGNDGAILLGTTGNLSGVALRLREFLDAQLSLHPTTGLSLLADTKSNTTFSVRWSNGESRLSADLPRLPSSATATYSKSDAGFTFDYHSAERLTANAHLKVLDGRASILLNVTELPKDLIVQADFLTKTVHADASSDLIAEVALAGPDGALDVADEWSNYLQLDRVATIETDLGSLPQFHVKLNRFLSMSAEFGDGVNLSTKFNGTPGRTGIRYNDVGGWISANITQMPDWVKFNLTDDNLTWRAAPTANFSMEGAGQISGFNGRWDVKSVPSQLDVEWARTGNNTAGSIFYANMTHNAPEGAEGHFSPSIFVEAKLNLTPNQPASYVKLNLQGIPNVGRLEANGGSGALFLGFARSGDLAARATKNVEAAYVADAATGLPWLPSGGVVAYARLAKGTANQFFVRLPQVETLALRTTPDPWKGGAAWLEYRAVNPQQAHIDIMDDAGTILRGNAHLPNDIYAELVLDPANGNIVFDYEASSNVSSWDMDWTKDGWTLRAAGSLPRELLVERLGNQLVVDASNPMTLEINYGRTGQPVRPEGIPAGEDYAFVSLPPAEVRIGVLLHDLQRLEVYPATGHYHIRGGAGTKTHLGVADGGTLLLRGSITQPAESVSLNLDYPTGKLAWSASGTTGGADLLGRMAGKVWRVEATSIPRGFDATVDAATGSALLDVWSNPTDSFGFLSLGYAGDAQDAIPRIRGEQGFALDTSGDAVRFAARITKLHRAEVAQGNAFFIDVQRANEGGEFTGEVRTADGNVDLYATDLPSRLTGTWEETTASGGLRFHLEAAGIAASHGDLFANFTGNSAVESVQAHVRRLPSMVDLYLAKGPNGMYASFDRGDPNPELFLNATTSDGLIIRGGLTSIPTNFTLATDKLANEFRFKAKTGDEFDLPNYIGLTGELLITQGTARTVRPPPGWYGASASLDPENEHVWFHVAGIKDMHWNRTLTDGKDHIYVTHTYAPYGPIALAFEDAAFTANLTAASLPREVTVDLERHSNITALEYRASDSTSVITVQASQKDGQKMEVDARLTNLPTYVWFKFHPMEANSFHADFYRNGIAAPDLWLDVDGPDGSILQGTIEGLPGWLELNLDPNPGHGTALQPACAFDLNTEDAIGLLNLTMTMGERRVSPWLRQTAEQWVGIDLVEPKAPALDVRLKDFRAAKFCWEGEGNLYVKAHVGSGNVAISYLDSPRGPKDIWRSFKGALTGITGGTYEVRFDADGKIAYTGVATILGLYLEGRMHKEKLMFDRDLSDFTIDAKGIPPYLEVNFSGEEIRLDSREQVLTSLVAAVNLLPKRTAPSAAGSGEGGSDFALAVRAANFSADWIDLQITDSGRVKWPGGGTHRIVFQDSGQELQLGIQLRTLRGADFYVGNTGLTGLKLDSLELQPNVPFRLFLSIPIATKDFWTQEDESSDFKLTVFIPKFPTDLRAHLYLQSIKDFELQVTPQSPLETVYVAFGETENTGWNFVLTDVPTTGLLTGGLGGAAFRTSLRAAYPVGGVILDFIEDAKHRFRFEGSNTKNLTLEGDGDGSLRHEARGSPRFVDAKMPQGSARVMVRYGDRGISMRADTAVITGIAAVAAWKVGSIGAEWAWNELDGPTAVKLGAFLWDEAKEWEAPQEIFQSAYS